MPRHHRHRPAGRPYHQRPHVWAVRAGCAAAVAGAVVLARCIPAPVTPAAPLDLCPVLRVLTATALFDRVPPADATPELVEAITRLNADLGQVRAQIEEAC